MAFFKTVAEIHTKNETFKQWEDKNAQIEQKRNKYFENKPASQEELAKAKQLGQRIIDTVTIMDSKSEDAAEDVETATQIATGGISQIGSFAGMAIGGLLAKNKLKDALTSTMSFKKFYKAFIPVMGLSLIGSAVTFIAASIYATKLQLQGSMVARYQARREVDDKDFIIYSDKQMSQAKEIAKTLPDDDKKKNAVSKMGLSLNPMGYFKNLRSLVADKKKAMEEAESKNSFGRNLKLTAEETVTTKEQQEILNRVIKKINNKAEEYSENMETTAGVILGSSFLLGGVVGNLAGKLTDKVIAGAKKFISFNHSEKQGSVVINNPIAKKFLRGSVGGMMAALITAPLVLILQKNAARAGRFEAKQELLKDPVNFISVDDKELDKIPDKEIKKEGFFSRILNVFTVIPQSIKSVFEYNKYKNGELKELNKLSRALKDVDVTKAQQRQGELLKNSVFKSFDKIDNYSQEYSEETEAILESSQMIVGLLGSVMLYLPAIAILYDKPSLATVISKLSGFVSKHMEAKWFKKYLDKVGNRISNVADKQEINNILAKFVEKHKDTYVKLLNGENVPDDVLQKVVDDLNGSYKQAALESLGKNAGANNEIPDEAKLLLNSMLKEWTINDLKQLKNKDVFGFIKEHSIIDTSLGRILKQFNIGPKSMIKNIHEDIKNLDNDKAVGEYFKNHPILKMLHYDKLTKQQASKLFENVENILDNLKAEDIEKIKIKLDEKFKNDPEKVIELLKNPKQLIDVLGLKGMAIAAGASYATLNLVGISIISAYLADLQKKAGRLGVMNAIDELDKEVDSMIINNDATVSQPKITSLNDNKADPLFAKFLKSAS